MTKLIQDILEQDLGVDPGRCHCVVGYLSSPSWQCLHKMSCFQPYLTADSCAASCACHVFGPYQVLLLTLLRCVACSFRSNYTQTGDVGEMCWPTGDDTNWTTCRHLISSTVASWVSIKLLGTIHMPASRIVGCGCPHSLNLV